MNIDKHKENGLYVDEEGLCYDDAQEFIQTAILGFCGCGDPAASQTYLRDVLQFIREVHENEEENWDVPWKRLDGFFHSVGERYTVFYLLDDKGLTEHGSSVPGWLTPKGRELLEDLNELYPRERQVE